MQPHEIQERRFTTTFRGYDPAEVRQFLAQVAALYADLQGRTVVVDERVAILAASPGEALAAEPPAELVGADFPGVDFPGAEPPGPESTVDDPPGLSLAAVGELRLQAQRQADDLLAAARAEAQTIVSRANDEAARVVLRARAESRGKPSAERSAAIEAALAEVPVDPEQARDQARLMITEARAVRERILADLAKRRRTAHVQLEQLRVAREKLLETFRDARRVAEDASRDLSTAEVEARLAAETAGRRVAAEPVPTVEELEAELFGGRFLTSSTSSGRPLVGDQPAVVDGGNYVSEELDDSAAELAPARAPTVDSGVSVSSTTPTVAKPASVDDLFARLRAERTEAADRARVLLAEAATAPPIVAKVPPASAKRSGTTRSAKPASGAASNVSPAAEAEAIPAVVIDVISAAAEPPALSVDSAAVEPPAPAVDSVDSVEGEADVPDDFGRDPAAIADLVAQRLARAIKRHLRDEQGSALVALRTTRGFPTVDALIGSDEDHRRRMLEVVEGALSDAGSPLSSDQLTEVTGEIITAIRGEFAVALEQVSSGVGDVADLPERIAGAYRVWTTERLDILIRHRSPVAA